MGMPSANFWRDKRVFLSGHTGFKGAWLSAWLLNLGAKVFGFSLGPNTVPSLSDLVGIEQRVASVRHDIRNGEELARSMEDFAPDIVMHLAAQSLVQRSYQEPVLTYEINVMGTVHLLEAARRTPSVRVIVVVTSDKCYENREWCWGYREDDHLGGFDPYSSSKACAELAVSAWRRSFSFGSKGDRQVAIATARAGNVIGGGDWAADRIVPDCIRALSAKRSVLVRNPHAVRPWQHVLEPLCGYLLLAERLWRDGSEVAEAWNFGPSMNELAPVSHIVERIVALWGDGGTYEVVNSDRPHEAGLLAVDPAKAMRRLGWQPHLTLEEALTWTTQWYKGQHFGASAASLVDADISRFEQLRDRNR
jgi:CDP-glucose 4,6-dehydratase